MPSYYDDLSDSDKESSPSSAEEDEKDTKSKDSEDENENTALLPKSFFKNKDKLKPGDIEKVKIVHLYDDEAEVVCTYSKDDKKDKDESSNDDSEEMSNAMDRMDEEMA